MATWQPTVGESALDVQQVAREVMRRLALQRDGQRNGRPREAQVRLGISSRHMHLCREDLDKLFGEGHELKIFKDLYQQGYYAAQERVLVVGTRRCIDEVRVLGPLRAISQVELSQTDAIALGLQLQPAETGSHPVSQPILLVGPKGQVALPGGAGGGAIIARRHVHMNQGEADALGLKDGDLVDLRTHGSRAITFHGILVRMKPEWRSEVHLDTDEANAAGLRNGQMVTLVVPERT